MRRSVATVVLVGLLQAGGDAQRRPPARRATSAMAPAAARTAILTAEERRLVLPDWLRTPSIDALRAAQMDDLRLLTELARSQDGTTQARAIRALGRLERRELVPELLQYLTTGPTAETANAIAQSFRGERLPEDTPGQQVEAAFEALVQVGVIPVDSRNRPGPIGIVARSIARLPYERAEQVDAAEAFLLTAMRSVDSDPQLRSSLLPDITRGMEALARLHSRIGTLDPETVDWLRGIVVSRRHDYAAAARVHAMMALVTARGVDAETLRAAAESKVDELRRLAAVSLGGAGAPVVATERTGLLIALLADRAPGVRIEGIKAWARRETTENGCQRLLDALKDPSLSVALAATDALGDQCKEDINVTDRLTVDARPPGPNEWHRASHALVALAKRAPGRAFVPLLTGHVQHVTWQVRLYAARAAAITGETSALERLAFDAADNVREATLAPLRRLKGEEAEPYFVAALTRNDYQLLRTAASELKGVRPTPQLAGGLLDALRRVTAERKETSRDVRLALLERVQELGDPQQAGALVPLLRDFDIPVAQLAAAAIQQWTGKTQEIDPQLLPRPPAAPDFAAEPARIELKSGKVFYVRLNTEAAPLTVARFVRLATAGYYNGLTFHRVVPNFVIQGGSPGANEYAGDSLYMHDEISPAGHERGTVGVSTRGRDTGDAQFFVNLVDNARLDFEYTVFGTAGPLNVIDDIVEGDVIASITFEEEKDDKM